MPSFSSRTPASFAPNALTRAIGERRREGLPILDATESNPTRAGIIAPQSLLEALRDPRALHYNPTANGLLEAREAIAARYGGHPDNIFLTSSTSESYSWLFKLLCEPGDEVLVPTPSYPLFDCLARLESVRATPYLLTKEDQWRIDIHSLYEAVSPQTKAVVLVNPNNPTGSYVKTDQLGLLDEFCARHELALIVDEVFLDYAFRTDHYLAPSFVGRSSGLTFTLNGLSKPAGLPQMKLGWFTVSGTKAGTEPVRPRLEWIADSYLPVCAPVQYAARAWLEALPDLQRPIRARIASGLALLRRELPGESGCSLLEPEGGWTAVIEVPRTRTEEDWALTLLNQDGVLLQPGFFYDFHREAFLVAGLLSDPHVLRAACRALIR